MYEVDWYVLSLLLSFVIGYWIAWHIRQKDIRKRDEQIEYLRDALMGKKDNYWWNP